MPTGPPPVSLPSLASARVYWLPFLAFAIFTTIEGQVTAALYPQIYGLKILVVTILLIVNREALRVIQPSSQVVVRACAVGIVVFAEWVVLDKLIPYPSLGRRVAYDPLAAFSSPGPLAAFLAVRMFGLVAVVPVIEELFWRGFALRYLTDVHFDRVPMGVFSASAFWIVTIASAGTHPEWPVALIAFALYAWLLKSTRSLFAVILAHAVTNAALGVYILVTRDWRYW